MAHSLLLADDSVTIRRVIELTFADEDVRVVSVSTGREAIAAIESSPPDIVLADAGMPDVSGYDIAAFVKGRADLRHIPVILLAGAFEPLDETQSRKAGADGVLVKPFEPQMVVTRVRELLSPGAPAVTAVPRAAAPAAPPEQPRPEANVFDEPSDQIPGVSDFADDLRQLGSSAAESSTFERQDFGDWDLPTRRAEPEPEPAADILMAPEPEPVVPPMPPPIAMAPKPAPPVTPPSVPPPAPAVEPEPLPHPPAAAAGPAAAMPLADAFTNLLAAEEGRPHTPIAAAAAATSVALTEAQMDAIVERVLARLGVSVHDSVIDLAERLVKAEIERLKALR